MRILFVYSFADVRAGGKPIRSWTSIHFGLSYLSSLLKEHGHTTRLAVLRSNTPRESLKTAESVIAGFHPDVICYTAVYTQYPFITFVASNVCRRWPSIIQVIGGPHATLNPEETVAGPFDAVCVGEGEYPMLDLCGRLQSGRYPHGIRNLWIRSGDGRVERNECREFIRDLDDLPFPDREMWEPWVIRRENAECSVLLGRGCPYDCGFCSNHALRTVSKGEYVRVRSPGNIMREIDHIHTRHGVARFYLKFESIAIFKEWAMELCDELHAYRIRTKADIRFGCNLRVADYILDENLFDRFRKANIRYINIGVESGCEKLRNNILKINFSNQQLLETVAMARKRKIRVNTYNLIGIPGETLNDHFETVRLNRNCQPDELYASIFYPYPGTALHRLCVDQGLLADASAPGGKRRRPVLELPGFSCAQILNALQWFRYRVYKRHKPAITMFLHAAKVRARSHPLTLCLYRWLLGRKTFGELRDLVGRMRRLIPT